MITASHLTKIYTQPDGEKFAALNDVSFHIGRSEVVSIIGPSGAGKSTLLRTLNLLEPPTSGQILVDGQDTQAPDYPLHLLRKRMGMVFPQFNLFPRLSVLENVALAPCKVLGMPKQQAEELAMEMLDKVSLGEKAQAMPSTLSSGQQQRTAIARCLAMRPEIILFDEPLSALDPTMVGEVQSVIRNLAREGMTMLIVTHNMKFAHDIATRTFFLRGGELVEDNTPVILFNTPQHPETLAFVQQIRQLAFDIESRHFDFYDMMSQIRKFCIRYDITEKMNNILHIAEEMLLLMSDSKTPIHIAINHSELSTDTTVDILHKGVTVSPLERPGVDELAVMIIRGMSHGIQTETTDEGIKLTFAI